MAVGGIECRITAKEIKELMIRDGYWDMKKPSIDRKDNNSYYTYENCRFIELGENICKDKRTAVLQFDKDNNFIQEWISQNEASRQLNISQANIFSACNNQRYSAGGFIWKYKEKK